MPSEVLRLENSRVYNEVAVVSGLPQRRMQLAGVLSRVIEVVERRQVRLIPPPAPTWVKLPTPMHSARRHPSACRDPSDIASDYLPVLNTSRA